MTAMPADLTASVQRAAAFVAARSRGDRPASESLLADFTDDGERAVAFCLLSELAIRLLADTDGESPQVTASRLAVMIAHAGAVDDAGAVAG